MYKYWPVTITKFERLRVILASRRFEGQVEIRETLAWSHSAFPSIGLRFAGHSLVLSNAFSDSATVDDVRSRLLNIMRNETFGSQSCVDLDCSHFPVVPNPSTPIFLLCATKRERRLVSSVTASTGVMASGHIHSPGRLEPSRRWTVRRPEMEHFQGEKKLRISLKIISCINQIP